MNYRQSRSNPSSPSRRPQSSIKIPRSPNDSRISKHESIRSSKTSNYQSGTQEVMLPRGESNISKSRPVSQMEYLSSFPNIYLKIRKFKHKNMILTKQTLKAHKMRLISPSPWLNFCRGKKRREMKKWRDLPDIERQPY